MSMTKYEWARQRILMKTLSAAPHLTRNFLNMQIWMSMTEDTKIKTYSAAPHMTRNFPNISIWMSIAEDTQRSKPFQLRLTWRDKIFSEHLVSMNELIKVRLDENLFSCSSSDKKFSEHLNLNEHGRGHSDENPYSCSSSDRESQCFGSKTRKLGISVVKKHDQTHSCDNSKSMK